MLEKYEIRNNSELDTVGLDYVIEEIENKYKEYEMWIKPLDRLWDSLKRDIEFIKFLSYLYQWLKLKVKLFDWNDYFIIEVKNWVWKLLTN